MLEIVDNLERADGVQAVPATATRRGRGAEGRGPGAARFKQKLERYDVRRSMPRASRSTRACTRRSRGSEREVPAGNVAVELQKGYRVGDRLLRPAMVSVSTGPATADEAAATSEPACDRLQLPPDYYETLGVDRGSTDAEIKAAYRQLALKWHPDRNPGDKAAEERFKELSFAYAVLSDEEKRGHYDRFGAVDGRAPFGGDRHPGATEFFDAIFGDLFGLGGGGRRGPRPALHAGAGLRRGGAGLREERRLRARRGLRRLQRHRRRGGHAGLITCARCGGEGVIRKRRAS